MIDEEITMNEEIPDHDVPSQEDASSEVAEVVTEENQGDEKAQLAAWNDLLDEDAADKNTGSSASGEKTLSKLDIVLDIPVTISLEMGHTAISIRNLLQLNQGSVVELDRAAGEPLDILVNGCLVAHGEVVMVNEKFGIRLTDIISPAERVKKLR